MEVKKCIHGIKGINNCKPCYNQYQREWRKKNRQKYIESSKKTKLKLLSNPLSEKLCINHGLITQENIDKWHRCRFCRREQNKKVYEKNHENWNSRTKEERQKKYNPEKIREYRLRHEKKLGEKHRQRVRAAQRKYSKDLYNGYVKFIISRNYKINRKEIPIELIEMERNRIKLRRKLLGVWKKPEYRRIFNKC